VLHGWATTVVGDELGDNRGMQRRTLTDDDGLFHQFKRRIDPDRRPVMIP
jgi:hypothetical protein